MMKKRTIWNVIVSVLCICSLLTSGILGGTALISRASQGESPENLGYEKVTLENFEVATGEIKNESRYGSYATATTLNGKYLDVDVLIPEDGTDAYFNYAGGGANVYWVGIQFQFSADKITIQQYHGTGATGYDGWKQIAYDTVGARAGEKFNLKIATNVGTSATVVDIWVNNIRQESMTIEGHVNVMGNWIGIWGKTKGITLTTPSTQSQDTPEDLGYEQVTLENFGVATGEIKNESRNGSYAAATTLNGKYLDVDVLVPEGGTDAYFNYAGGGANVYWVGIQFQFSADKITIQQYHGTGATGYDGWKQIAYDAVGAQAGEKFNLKIATNVSSSATVIDIWINNIRQESMTIEGHVDVMGNWIGIWGKTKGITLTTPGTQSQDTPESLGYERITLEGFGITPGFVSQSSSSQYAGADNLNGKYLDVDVLVPEGGTETKIHYSAVGVAWNGILLTFGADSMNVQPLHAGSGAAYGAPLNILYGSVSAQAGTKFNLKIAVNGSQTETTVDIWVNDIRQQRMVIAGTVVEVGNGMVIRSDAKGITLTIPGADVPPQNPEDPPQPPEPVVQKTPEELGYSKVVLEEFGILDGDYPAETGMTYGSYIKGDSLEGKYLDVDVQTGTTNGTTSINYGGSIAGGWYGVKIMMLADAIQIGMCLNEGGAAAYAFELTDVSITAPTDKFNYKIASKVEGTDVVVDVWINDIRVNPMVFAGCAGEIGNWLGIYAKDQGIKVATPGVSYDPSATPEKMDASFRKITFGNFKIKDGTYAYENEKSTFVNGAYGLSMNKTAFTGDITLSPDQSDFRYGGQANGWYGLRFWLSNGNLFMQDVDGKTEVYVFLPGIAEVDFNQTFNLGITIEYVDCDKDGVKDDVKLGVWFNNKLYKNQYIDLQDYQPIVGKYVGIVSGASTITVKSVAGIETGVDYTIWGYTRNWKKELGIK